jgi:Ca-activated chloride channel family protein
MAKVARLAILLSLLLASIHQASAQSSQPAITAGFARFAQSRNATAPDRSSNIYIATLNKDGPDLTSMITSARKAGQNGPPGPIGGLGNVAAGGVDAGVGIPGGTPPFDVTRVNMTMLERNFEKELSPLEDPVISVSRLDLKAPSKARKEYDKAFRLLNRKDYQSAVEHLAQAILIYPEFVAAHNALGSSYLGLGKNEQARDEFSKAAALDDHLPISHLNLGCAELALKHYPAAEAAVQKASSIAPLDLQVLSALAYAQLLNDNYTGTVATAHQVHSRSHKGVAIVHYYAAAAADALHDQNETRHELQTFLNEDPNSPAAQNAREILKQITEPTQTVASLSLTSSIELAPPDSPAVPGEMPSLMREFLQDTKQAQQIGEAEAMCDGCESTAGPEFRESPPDPNLTRSSGWTLHTDVNEVVVSFSATDHGKAVSNLTTADFTIRDGNKPPASIVGFRSEAQLPLRLALVIDTSESVTNRFSFEQAAAANFADKVLTGREDLAFVVGFSNSVLLVQDFTADNGEISEAINKLAPAGGTSVWDAVVFAADKLASRPETQPVARVLVVISDGEDNSSSSTLKQAIEAAERDEVTVYAVSTHEDFITVVLPKQTTALGDHALKTLADRTGGTALLPGSLGHLSHSLDDLQAVIRSRYMVSYRPAPFKRDGLYHSIDITAQKSGHKLHVYARKGYVAQARPAAAAAAP